MNWDDLKVFLAVARTESLSAAGRVLKIDAATAGRRIARLEAELGAPLFAKSPQGYALTGAGEVLLPRAEAAETAIAGASDTLRGQDASLSGTIRIGAPDGCATFVLPQVVAAIRAAHPQLVVHVIALPRVFNLTKREADLAVAVSRPATGRLTARKIADYRLHLAAADSYLDRAPPIASQADLAATHPIVGYVPDMIFDTELDYLGEAGVSRVDLACNSVSVQGRWLQDGAGVGIIHDFMLPFLPGVRRVLTDRVSLMRTFWLIRHADDRRLERLNRFADLLVDGMRSELARLEAQA